MLSKEEQKQKNTQFWTEFKRRMRKHMSSNGRRMNWLNYPTEIRDIYLRLEASGKGCAVHFDIQCKDEGIRSIVWEQMGELKVVLESEMPVAGEWQEEVYLPTGQAISRITWSQPALNYFKESDEVLIYEFLKDVLLGFDRFYQEYKDILIALME